jgi:ligand-binding sensor domain-containing protein
MKLKFIFIICSLFSTAHAADLIFTPATPVVEINKHIQLSVSGASGDVTWNASKGKIVKGVDKVTYIASDQTGLDVVTAFDNQGNVGTLKIIVITPTISLENSVWKVFTNRSWITALLLSADNNTLYVGTWGGLEERDAKTGEIKRIWTNLDGLPENRIRSIITDNNGQLWVGTQAGLAHLNTKGNWEIIKSPNNQIWSLFYQNGIWLGTENGGLAYRNTKGDWQVFNTENSKLPNNNIRHITGDTKDGIWIATVGGGIAHRHVDGNWEIFNTDNSNLPDNNTNTILTDNKGGIWVGTAKGLAHRDKEGRWNIFNSDIIYSIIHDANNGIWIGSNKGLAHRDKDGKLEIFNTENSGLPDQADFFFPLVNGSPTSPKGAVLALLTDKRGGIWVGTWAGGLARRNADTSWNSFYNQNSLTDIDVQASAADGKGGIWIGTNKGGLVHRDSNGKWEKFNTDNSGLPDNSITAITTTDTELWVGSFQNGLANRDINGNWQSFKTYNSPLPSNTIISLLAKDGLWMGTLRGGLAHRYTDNTWKIFNTQNSELASNNISVLVSDNQNGLWIGTLNGGLAYLRADNTWNIFNTDNSSLPSNNIYSLLLDNNNSLWVGTDKGLAHRKNDGSWEIPKKIPTKPISSLITDERGDIWIGTYNGLIYYRHTENKLTIFNTENSGLPGNGIDTLVSDGLGGIWVGGNDLAHLTFGNKFALCKTNQETCLNKNAAIIIAGGGNHSQNTLWDTTESIANYTYKVLNKRGFLNENIFYINPRSWADFNGDGLNDRIVDAPKPERPLKVEDIRDALTWAKKRGKLDQPLYIFFIDHGGDTKFQLSKLNDMSATEFKAILDDYQKATDNEIVLVIDACYSGNLLKQIIAPKRSIISSTGTGLAYFDRENKKGFAYFFASGLLRGMSFFEAFEYSSAQQAKLLGNITKFLVGSSTKTGNNFKQEPQLEDGNNGDKLRKLFMNGSFVTGDTTLAIESLTTSTTIAAGKTITLKAQIALAQGQIKKAWAVIIPPKINLVIDRNGTPLLAFPRILLSPNKKNPNFWQRNWQAEVYNGDYQIRFYAEDDQGNIASSDKELIITVNAGVNPPSEANVELLLTKTNYKPGEQFKAELIENLNWGYDLYAALILPDNNFIAIENTNKAAAINEAKKWDGNRSQTNKITLFDLTLPDNLAKGKYCLYGILSPAKEAVLETVPLWVIKKQCFNIK